MSRKCNKFENDKYYTPSHIVDYVIAKTIDLVGLDFSCVIEPSAGGGAFIDKINEQFPDSDNLFMDLYPTKQGIIKQDYLEYKHNKEGKTLVIGNPPFGSRNILSVKFFKHSIKFADTIVFILPISQLNNNQQMYEFDLIHSEDLGKHSYSNENGDQKEVHCCLNIYKKPKNNNKKPRYKFSNFKIIEYRRSSSDINDFDYKRGICAWGVSIGKTTKFVGEYAQEFYFLGDSDIIDFVVNFNWIEVCSITATPSLMQWHIYEEVKKHFKLYPLENKLDI